MQKGENMPKDNIDKAIKRADAKDVDNYVVCKIRKESITGL